MKKPNKTVEDLLREQTNKLDIQHQELDKRLDNIEKVMIAQEINLKEHMRRTDILEESIKPIQKHVTMVEGVFKFLGLLSLLIGIVSGVARILGFV